ncbi:hypothetical protein ES703_41626 [subsurface metagenome]
MPLTKEQLIKMSINLGKAETVLREAEGDVREAKRAGISVIDEEKELALLRKSIRGLRNVYRPV